MNLKEIFNNLIKCKSPQELINEGVNSELKKTLNAFDLIILGIGAVVGLSEAPMVRGQALLS